MTEQLDPETLAMFVEEALDALARTERRLLEAERGSPAPDLVAVLFRDMHTLKGTSGFLHLDRITQLAHGAEDALAGLRDRKQNPTGPQIAALLTVVDGLRKMIASARDHGHDDVPFSFSLRAAFAPAGGPPAEGRLGEILIARGMIDRAKLDAAMAAQQKGRLGSVLVSLGYVTPEQLAHALAAQPPPRKLGEILVEQGAVTDAQIAEALQIQADQRVDPARAEAADTSVRVSVQVLDRLMNLMGQLVQSRNQMAQIARTHCDGNVHALAAVQQLGQLTSEIQEQVVKTRLQPIARALEKVPRLVRDLGESLGKRIEHQVDGGATELDRALIDAVRDAILHIVRNAIDHGIERPDQRVAAGKPPVGRLSVRASHEAGMVCIEIEDDGRGMDPQALRQHAIRSGLLDADEAGRLGDREALDLVFRPGFSTAPKVTDLSGRGVGMDVVRTQIERAGGLVELVSEVGRGTTIRLKLPLTLAIIPALLLAAGGQRFCIPQASLVELVCLSEWQSRAQIERVCDAEVYRRRGEILPVVRLHQVLGLPAAPAAAETNLVVVAVGKQRYGLIVDEVLDTEEIVVKPLHPRLQGLACYSGATVLGDGAAALILEVRGIGERAGIAVAGIEVAKADSRIPRAAAAGPADRGKIESLLVVSVGADTRCAVPLSTVARLEQIPAGAIERVGNREVAQYRGGLLPLIRAEDGLPLGRGSYDADDQQVVVLDVGRPVGLRVNAILDAIEAEVPPDPDDARPGTLGQAVLLGRTTLLLDVHDLVRRLAPGQAPLRAVGGAR